MGSNDSTNVGIAVLSDPICSTGTVKANWRIIFRFEDEDVYDVELRDYH